MIKSIPVKPLGVPLHKFVADVDVVAQNVKNGNLLIKIWNNLYKELTFSEEEECWLIKEEMSCFPCDESWKRLVKGVKEDETDFCTAIPCGT